MAYGLWRLAELSAASGPFRPLFIYVLVFDLRLAFLCGGFFGSTILLLPWYSVYCMFPYILFLFVVAEVCGFLVLFLFLFSFFSFFLLLVLLLGTTASVPSLLGGMTASMPPYWPLASPRQRRRVGADSVFILIPSSFF